MGLKGAEQGRIWCRWNGRGREAKGENREGGRGKQRDMERESRGEEGGEHRDVNMKVGKKRDADCGKGRKVDSVKVVRGERRE